MNDILLGKKFIFAIVAIVCVSIVSTILRFDATNYLELIKTICGVFLVTQAATDIMGKKGDNNGQDIPSVTK